MQRRNFLYNSGILASAIVASPSALWTDKSEKTNVLIIYDTAAGADEIHSVIKNSTGLQVKELPLEQLNELVYSSGGFLVTMNDNKRYRATKVIFSSYREMDVSRVSVNIKTEDKNIGLRHGAGNHNTPAGPEFWALTSRKFDNGKVRSFLQRNKHAFLCIS